MRFMHVRRASAAAAASLAVAVLAAACSSSTSTSSASSPSSPKASSSALETTHVVVGALPVVDTAGLYLALKNGYFKQAGLDVTVDPIQQSTAALPDMLHGTVDIVAGANYVSWFQAQAKGTVSLKILASGTVCTPATFGVLALPSSGITKPANLAGKTIAVNLTNNVQTLTANTMLKAAGVNPSSVHYVVIPFPDMITALKAHRVDAISAVEPFVDGAKAAGAQQVLSECQGPTASFPLSGYFATSTWAQSHPNTARAFQQALEKGQAYADANPGAVRSILPTYTKITSAAAAKLALVSYPSTLDAAPMQRVVTMMVSGGLITKPLDVSALLFG
ncbi:MAG TPA: ABC transporter substrate-binding protein [Trebonia sp.]|jgi:NitT/TauT family transport system substrate-binding protein|nr:ABC transporter substrate-binding protein [Trebonia sp.]